MTPGGANTHMNSAYLARSSELSGHEMGINWRSSAANNVVLYLDVLTICMETSHCRLSPWPQAKSLLTCCAVSSMHKANKRTLYDFGIFDLAK